MKPPLRSLLTVILLVAATFSARAQRIPGLDSRPVPALPLRDSTKTFPLQNIPGLTVRPAPAPGPSSQPIRIACYSRTTSNQPLYVIDGRPLSYDQLLPNLNPGDIEKLEVLKGAAATALFGSRGQYGVLLITTRRKPVVKPYSQRPLEAVAP